MDATSAQRAVVPGLNTERWLEAVCDPGARLYVLPGGLEMLDVAGNGDPRLVCTDLGTATRNSAKLRIFRGGDLATEHNLAESPSGVVGFYSENGERSSAALAVAAGASVYVYKNGRPYFKYCLPRVEAHPSEREIWHKVGLEDEPNVSTLVDELESLAKELGASLVSARTLELLSTREAQERVKFVERYRRIPLTRGNVATTLGLVARDTSPNPISASYLLIGTEFGQILVLDTRAFTVIDRLQLGWTPVAVATRGPWNGEARIFAIGRDGRIGSTRRGRPTEVWDKLPAPAVSLASLDNDGVAVATMDSCIWGFSKFGARLWKVELPNVALDTASIPVPSRGLALLAVSVVGHGVRVYDGSHHVDTINTTEPISAMKYGKLGQEERAMAMVSVGGGLNVKILKRTADLLIGARGGNGNSEGSSIPPNSGERFAIPKKTRLFVEQTIRERSEAVKMHDAFQRGLARLRLTTVQRAVNELITDHQDSKGITRNAAVLDANLLGLGPEFAVEIRVTNVSDRLSEPGLFLVCRCDANASVRPTITRLPLLPSGLAVPVRVTATSRNISSGKIKIMLCQINRAKPIAVISVVVPAIVDEEIQVF